MAPSGDVITCPICHVELTNNLMGVNSHLRAHIRKGELKEKERLEVRLKMQKHRFIKHHEQAA